jgi:uncharacterized protein (DUF302 family)
MNFEKTIESSKTFDDTMNAIERKASEKGFRVLHTHDVAVTLAEEGFRRGPLKIIEICNARHANAALEKEVEFSLILPCLISVYEQQGKTFVSALLPSRITAFFPGARMESIASEVEETVLAIIKEATNAGATAEPLNNQRGDEEALSRMAAEGCPNSPERWYTVGTSLQEK